jgi:methionyl-tRNA formyltransferase
VSRLPEVTEEVTLFGSSILFMGTPEFAVPSLELLLNQEYPVLAVVTAPDKPRGRGQQLSATPIKHSALLHHLPVLQPASLKDPTFLGQISAMKPDLIIIVAFRILPKELFTIPRLGAFNLHASLLPKYRGAAPINWAIINGETETGVTTFFLQEKVDTGNVLLQARIPIGDDDDAGSIHDKLSEIGAEIVLHTVRLIEQGKALPRPQDNALASPAPKLFKEDCRIDWHQPALSIHNRIRGLSPFPSAFTLHDGRILKIFRSQVLPTASTEEPGTVLVTPRSFHVASSDSMLALKELQVEGRTRMGVEEFLRGYNISTGEHLA